MSAPREQVVRNSEPAVAEARAVVPRWLGRVRARTEELQNAGLRRVLSGGTMARAGLDYGFASNDYLGLARHPKLIEAVRSAAAREGVGSGASRLLRGESHLMTRLEARFAEFKCAEGALLFPTGFMANFAVLSTLPQAGDLIAIDKLAHASLIDGARYAAGVNGCCMRVYAHGDLGRLEELLTRHEQEQPECGRWIVTDSVFSMDGDVADLGGLARLRDRFGAGLILDEAHGTGVLGRTGAGLDEEHAADITISTASKALGSLGGVVTAKKEVIEYLVTAARAFIYTTAPPPTQAAAIEAGLDVIADEPERRERLAGIGQALREGLRAMGWEVGTDRTPIIPLRTGTLERTNALSEHLRNAGFYCPAIRPPTVGPGACRIRLSVRTDLNCRQVEGLMGAIRRFGA